MFKRRNQTIVTAIASFIFSIVLIFTAQPISAQDVFPGEPAWWGDSIRHIGSKPDRQQKLWFTASEDGEYRIKIWWGQDIDPSGDRPFDCDIGECQTGETGHVTLNGTTPDAAIYDMSDGRLGWHLGYTELERSLVTNDEIYSVYGSMNDSINVYVEVERTSEPPLKTSFSCTIPNTIGLEWGRYYLHEVREQNRVVHVKHEGIVISPLSYSQDWENDGLPHPILDEDGTVLATFIIEYHYGDDGNISDVECYIPEPESDQPENDQPTNDQPESTQPHSGQTASEPTPQPVAIPYVCANTETIVSTAYDPQLYNMVAEPVDPKNQREWELVRYDVVTEDSEQVVVFDDILTDSARYNGIDFMDVVSLEPNHNCIIASIATPVDEHATNDVARGKVYFIDYGGNLLSILEDDQYDYVHVEWTANYTVIAVRREQQPDGSWSQPRAYLTDRTGSFWIALGEGSNHQSLNNVQTGEPVIAYTTTHQTLAFLTLRQHQVDRQWDTGLSSDRAEWMPDGSRIFVKSGDMYHVLEFDNSTGDIYSNTFEARDVAIDPENDGDVIVSNPLTDNRQTFPELDRLELLVDPVAAPINSDWVDPQDGTYQANLTPVFDFLDKLQALRQQEARTVARTAHSPIFRSTDG
ncbi:MAG: hypothetical protein CL607_27750 [Anaerolineaceae bacterium]|nr:hypothetical protein [Anaerolineaceae bacterium]